MGINLIRYLLKREMEITNLDISPFTYNDCRDLIRDIQGDICTKSDVYKAVEEADIIVHCAAALPLYKEDDIFSTEVGGTKSLLEAASARNISRFVHISSTAVYGVPDHHPIYEGDPLVGVGPYGKAKIMAEEICLQYRESGLTVSIIRPKSFIGPERLWVFALLYDWAYTGHNFPVLGKGNNRYQFLDVEDLCEAIYLCMTLAEDKVKDTYNIGAKEFGTLREDFQVVLDAAGYNKKIVSIPMAPGIAILRLLEKLGASPLYEWIYETVAQDSFVSIEKAEKNLGFTPKYSNKDALLRSFSWYIDHGDEFQGKSGISHRTLWNQGLLELAKIFF